MNLTNDDILNLYKKGYSIKYLTNLLHRSLNKNQKPIKLDGQVFFPPKIYTKDFCRIRVCEIIYNNTIRECLSQFPL